MPTVACAAHVGLTRSANEWPPSVDEYIVPSVDSPTMLFAFLGSTITSNPSPPAGSTIWLVPLAKSEVPLSCNPPHTPRPPRGSDPARAS
jgi:hypothetical protein